MSYHTLKLDTFTGVVTGKNNNNITLDNSPDACNFDTSGGRLAVAGGLGLAFTSGLSQVPKKYRLYMFEKNGLAMGLVCTDGGLYYYSGKTSPRTRILNLSSLSLSPDRFDFQLAKIGSDERLIISCGASTLYKWDFTSSAPQPFGSAEQLSNLPQRYLSLYFGRLFSAGNPDNPARLYWSKAPGGDRTIEDWSYDENSPNVSGGHVEVGTDTDPITGLFALSNQLVILKRDSIYRLIGDRPSSFRILPVDATLEQPLHTAVVQRGDRLFFLTKSGLSFYDGQTVQHPAYGRNIRGILKNVSLDCAVASSCGDKLYFAVKESPTAAYNDLLIEFDTSRECFMLRRGQPFVDISSCHGKQYVLDDRAEISVFDGSRYYSGQPINASWTTPLIDLGSKATDKQLIELYAVGEGYLEVEVLDKGGVHRSSAHLKKDCLTEIPLHGGGRVFRLRIKNGFNKPLVLDSGLEILMDVQRRPL